MRAGYAALDEATRAKVENLTSYHSAQYTGARRTGLFPREPDFWNRSQIFGKGACLTYRSLISGIGA